MSDNFFMGNNNNNGKHNTAKSEALSVEAPVSRMRKAGGNVMGWVVRNHAELLAVVLIAFAVLVVCVDNLEFDGVFWRTVTSPETLLLATCSYMLYINSSIIGENVANKVEFTTTINNAYNEEIKKIRAKRIEWLLEVYCNEFKVQELKYSRSELLLCAGFTEKQVSDILNGVKIDETPLTDDQKKALKKAKALKPIKLNKSMLVNATNEHSERSPIRSATAIQIAKYKAFALKLITTAISFIFVVSLSISITKDFSPEAIIYALFQIGLMLFSLFGGMSIGYKTKIRHTARLQDIVGVLYSFWEWLELREKQPTSE